MSKVRNSNALAVICLTLLNSSIVCAAPDNDGAVSLFLACAAMTDDAKRLACYDQEASELTSSMKSASADGTATDDVASVSTPTPSKVSGGDEPSETSSLTSADKFGTTTNRKGERTELVVTVAHIRKRAYGQLVLTMENGQVWTEKNAVKGIRIRKGDTLTIRRGSFGGYRLITRSKRSSAVTRVK